MTTDEPAPTPPHRGPTRRTFLGLLAGGAATGAATGYAIGHQSKTALVPMTIYLASSGQVHALHATTGTVRWIRQIAVTAYTSITTWEDTIYVPCKDKSLHALHARTGAVRWIRQIDHSQLSGPVPPAVADGVLYITSDDGDTYALDARTGAVRWRRQTTSGRADNSPVISGGIVYIGDPDSYLYALDAATGSIRWRFGTGQKSSVGTTTLAVAGRLLLANGTDNLYVFDAKTGQVRRTYPPRGLPTVVGGMLYVSADDGSLQATDPATFHVRWTHRVPNATWGTPAAADGILYFDVSNKDSYTSGDWIAAVTALKAATGELVWTYPIREDTVYGAVAAAGTVYGVGLNSLYALDASVGGPRWIYSTDYEIWGTPATLPL